MFLLNWFDAALILLLILGLAIGYSQGLLRQVINLASLYIGAILGAQYYHFVGKFLIGLFPTTPGTLLNDAAFFIILIFIATIINFLARDAYHVDLRILPWINHLAGMLIGLAGMWILVTLAVNVLTFATSTPTWAGADDVRQLLLSGLGGSALAGATRETFPTLISALKPWLPTGVPAIFDL